MTLEKLRNTSHPQSVCSNMQLYFSTPRHVQTISETHPTPYAAFAGIQKMKPETHVRLLQRLETRGALLHVLRSH